MDDERTRKIGAASGMIHALVVLKREIGVRTFHPIPPRHTRKLRERELQVAALREVHARLEADLRRLQAAIGHQPPE